MSTTITLTRSNLHFLDFGTGGKIHARAEGFSDATLCGHFFENRARTLTERSLSSNRLCGRCYATLRTYTNGVQIEREVTS